jgi:hypothetical protein
MPAGSSTRRHFGVARRARRAARKAGAAGAVSAARRLFKSVSVRRRKVSKARRVARRGARKAASAGRKAIRAARKGLKRYSALHKSSKAVGTKSEVWKGLARHTAGGLRKSDIVRKTIRRGGKVVHRYVSRKKLVAGKARGLPPALKMWRSALRRAGAKGVPKKGSSAYKKAKSIYRAMRADSQSRSADQADYY